MFADIAPVVVLDTEGDRTANPVCPDPHPICGPNDSPDPLAFQSPRICCLVVTVVVLTHREKEHALLPVLWPMPPGENVT